MENTARYDRQLRIWGAHGQQRLERAKIIVLNASSVGTEVLKNLVLGGIGSFTVVDDAIVTDEDFGRSYFVDPESYQKPRVEVACRLLRELNDAVIATPVNASPKELIDKQPEMFKDFSLVIATQVSSSKRVSHFKWTKFRSECRKWINWRRFAKNTKSRSSFFELMDFLDI